MTKINQIPQILVAYSPLQQPSPRMQTMIELRINHERRKKYNMKKPNFC
jgi:hypothetical protein